MQKFKIWLNGNKPAWIIGITALAILTFAIGLLFTVNNHGRLALKVIEYAKSHGMTVEAVQKDKLLMAQLQLDSEQEEKIDRLTQNIEVSKEEIENYKNMIGTTMDQEKAILVLFNTPEKCRAFIDEYGNDQNPASLGIGTLPLMQDDENGSYYNIIGNESLESVFDSLKDGEYTKEPFQYSGMYCYMKRIGISSPINDEKELIKLIKNEKAYDTLNNQSKK